jgi:hypothetical protein
MVGQVLVLSVVEILQVPQGETVELVLVPDSQDVPTSTENTTGIVVVVIPTPADPPVEIGVSNFPQPIMPIIRLSPKLSLASEVRRFMTRFLLP